MERRFALMKSDPGIRWVHLPDGGLFCFDDKNYKQFIINKDYEKRYLPSGASWWIPSAIYFKRNVYCFGGESYDDNSYLNIYADMRWIKKSYRFDLDENRWIRLTRMPLSDRLGNSIVFNENIMISGYKNKNLFIYSIDLDSFSTISYEFASMKVKILADAKERLYLIECNGSVYECDIGDEYAWKRVAKSMIKYSPRQVDCSYNKGKIYISTWFSVMECIKFDLDQKTFIDITYISENTAFSRVGSKLQGIKWNDQTFKLKPDHAAAYINKGLTLSCIAKNLELIEKYNEAIKLNPENEWVYRKKGDSLSYLGRYLEAIESYNESIRLFPEEECSYVGKGDALYNLGRILEAIKCYNKAIKLDPEYDEAYTKKGIALHNLGRNIEAIDTFNEAILHGCSINRPYYFKGNALYDLDRNLEALEFYNKAIEHNCCDRYYCYLKKGNVLYDLGRNLEAVECYHEAIKLYPDDPLYLCYRAHILSNLGQESEAMLDCNKANDLIAREISMNPYWISLGENDDFMQKTLIQWWVESRQALIKLQESVVEFKNKIQKLRVEIQKSLKNSEMLENVEAKEEIIKQEHWKLLKKASDCLLHYETKSHKEIIQIKKEANEQQKATIDAVSQLRLLFYATVINYLDS